MTDNVKDLFNIDGLNADLLKKLKLRSEVTVKANFTANLENLLRKAKQAGLAPLSVNEITVGYYKSTHKLKTSAQIANKLGILCNSKDSLVYRARSVFANHTHGCATYSYADSIEDKMAKNVTRKEGLYK